MDTKRRELWNLQHKCKYECERTWTKLKLIGGMIVLVMMLAAIVIFGGWVHPTVETKDQMHEIATLAREAGLSEDDPIIVRAKELWWEAHNNYCSDRDILATVMYNEAGHGCSDRHMELVGGACWNRVHHDAFPNTIYDVVVQKGQYHPAYADPNSYYSKRAREDAEVWAKCQELAAKVINGEVEIDPNVVFQANFKQGSGVYETHYTSYSTTYFCYY